jgi:hypothetical protein
MSGTLNSTVGAPVALKTACVAGATDASELGAIESEQPAVVNKSAITVRQ